MVREGQDLDLGWWRFWVVSARLGVVEQRGLLGLGIGVGGVGKKMG